MMARAAIKALSLPRRYNHYFRDWLRFAGQMQSVRDERFEMRWSDRMPSLWENSATTSFDAHYIYHTAWAVRMVTRLAPAKHVDISSTLYFCSTLSAVVPVDFYDFRPASLTLDGLRCGREDLTHLSFADNSIASLSCMHTIEHVGLGRYGDAVNPKGDLKAAAELKRVVKPGGHLIIVLPVGTPRICFNAHRIYSHAQVTDMFGGFSVVETALVKDSREFARNPAMDEFDAQSYGCGCFLFQKA
jgi:SAM-dependent methyltransferase